MHSKISARRNSIEHGCEITVVVSARVILDVHDTGLSRAPCNPRTDARGISARDEALGISGPYSPPSSAELLRRILLADSGSSTTATRTAPASGVAK